MKNKRHAGTENLARMRERQRAEDRPPGLKHGINSFLMRGQLPDAVRKRLDAFETGMVTDLGGDPTTGQQTLIESTRVCFGVILLAAVWIAENGAVRKSGRPHYILNILAAYLNTLRLNLMALGLERRTKTAQTLESVVAEYTEVSADARPDHSRHDQ